MALFVIQRKLTKDEAEENIKCIEDWFKANPKRKVCKTELGKIRKSHVREEIMEHTEKEIKNCTNCVYWKGRTDLNKCKLHPDILPDWFNGCKDWSKN